MTALRLVLDTLRNPVGNKMFSFGLTVTDQFKGRLKEFKTFCDAAMQLPHFPQFTGTLRDYIECGARGQEPLRTVTTTSSPSLPVQTTTVVASSGSTAPVTTAASAMHGAIERPNRPPPKVALVTAFARSLIRVM